MSDGSRDLRLREVHQVDLGTPGDGTTDRLHRYCDFTVDGWLIASVFVMWDACLPFTVSIGIVAIICW